jgi:hypothetical protein
MMAFLRSARHVVSSSHERNPPGTRRVEIGAGSTTPPLTRLAGDRMDFSSCTLGQPGTAALMTRRHVSPDGMHRAA